MGAFPHGTLLPEDVTPRIKSSSAERCCELIDRARANGIGRFNSSAAIIVAVFDGPMVKYLVDEQQVEETIRRLRARLAVKGAKAAEEITYKESLERAEYV